MIDRERKKKFFFFVALTDVTDVPSWYQYMVFARTQSINQYVLDSTCVPYCKKLKVPPDYYDYYFLIVFTKSDPNYL